VLCTGEGRVDGLQPKQILQLKAESQRLNTRLEERVDGQGEGLVSTLASGDITTLRSENGLICRETSQSRSPGETA